MPLNYISVESLTDGEVIALDIIEITSIPHISIIDERSNVIDEIVEKYKNEIISLLNEIYQSYKTYSYSANYAKDLSIELLWMTKAVQNQPYNAQINLYIIVRAIDGEPSKAKESVETLVRLCQSAFSLQKYECQEIPYSSLSAIVSHINDTNIRAIVKEEKAENLQNQLLPVMRMIDFPFQTAT